MRCLSGSGAVGPFDEEDDVVVGEVMRRSRFEAPFGALPSCWVE
ncbi:hypothetical protein [Kineococcus arenarius]